MTRTITTSYIRALERQAMDATPFPKASDDISLVNVVANTAHLGPMVTNAHAACTAIQLAAGAGAFGGLELSAPASRTLAIYNLENMTAQDYRCGLAPVGTFTGVAAAPCMEWGDEDLLAEVSSGTRNTALTVRYVILSGNATAAFTPIYVAPGETFSLQQTIANQDFVANIAWEEFG